MFPLSNVLFPHAVVALHVFEPRYRSLVADCLTGDGLFGVVLIARGSEIGGGDERFAIGTTAAIEHADALPDGRWHLVARGTRRIRVRSWRTEAPYPVAEVEDFPGAVPAPDGGLLRASQAVRRVRALLSELGDPAPAADLEVDDDPDALAWRLCASAPVNPLDRHQLLETADAEARLALVAELCDAMALDVTRLLARGGD